MKEELIKILVEAIDLKKIAYVVLDDIVEKALAEVVARTDNPFDDIMFASMYPALEAELKKLVDEKLDLKKLVLSEDAE